MSSPLDDLGEQKPREECGVFAVWAPEEEVAKLTFYGLFALQHRGQEAAGIAVADISTGMSTSSPPPITASIQPANADAARRKTITGLLCHT